MTHFYYVFRTVLDFTLLIVGIWAIATLTVELAIMKRKSRPRRQSTERQKKLYIHSIADDR